MFYYYIMDSYSALLSNLDVDVNVNVNGNNTPMLKPVGDAITLVFYLIIFGLYFCFFYCVKNREY